MALVKPDVGRLARIKVIGVGGGGGNALNSMINSGTIQGVEFIVVNTDAQVLLTNLATTKLQIGDNLTVIPNQRLLDVIDLNMTLLEAFRVGVSVCTLCVQGIPDIITVPGLIN